MLCMSLPQVALGLGLGLVQELEALDHESK
jgi:hypothetical protein